MLGFRLAREDSGAIAQMHLVYFIQIVPRTGWTVADQLL